MKILIIIATTLISSSIFARGSDIGERYEVEAQLEKIQSTTRNPSSEQIKLNHFDHIDKKDRFKIKFDESL